MKNGNFYSLGFMGYCSHDPAACLACLQPSGAITYIHYEEGMLSRKKKSYQFPLRAIASCLDHFAIEIDDVDIVCLDYMNVRSVHNTAAYYRKLMGDYIRASLSLREEQIHIAESHHLAHAYTAFYPSGFDSAAILVIDGLGSEQKTHSIFEAEIDNGISHIYSQQGTGIGKLYSTITQILGFGSGEEGKTMGLAPYGANHAEMDAKLPSLKGNYMGYCIDYSHLIQREPTPNSRISVVKCTSKEDVYSPLYARLAFNIQEELEAAMLHLAQQIAERTGMKNLCIAGGVGLNCVANEAIRSSGIFENVYVQPASGDTGIPLGLALIGLDELAKRRKKGRVEWRGKADIFWTYAPKTFDSKDVRSLLARNSIPHSEIDVNEIAKALKDAAVVAYFESGWEFGPRALGHRSFLADPRSPEMKSILNKKIKHREAYRPFAPIILENCFDQYFESSVNSHPHMLYAVKCREKAIKEIPTIVHEDNTARVQTCGREAGRIYKIIEKFYELTNVPVLVNTSLNDNDEPIVHNQIDALSCFLRTNADLLVIDDIMIWRRDIPDGELLTAQALHLQTENIKNKTKEALERLLWKRDKFEDPRSFLARNLLASLYEKNVAAEERLVKDLFFGKQHSRYDYLVTDQYHYEILMNLSDIYKVSIPFKNIQIVDDIWDSLSLIKNPSYILLYNFSVYFDDKEIIATHQYLTSCISYYRTSDRRILASERPLTMEDIIKLVSESYETNSLKSIDQFFAESVHPEFIRNYLS